MPKVHGWENAPTPQNWARAFSEMAKPAAVVR